MDGWCGRVIIVSALSLSLRDKDRLRDWEIERAWQLILEGIRWLYPFSMITFWNIFKLLEDNKNILIKNASTLVFIKIKTLCNSIFQKKLKITLMDIEYLIDCSFFNQ